MTNYKQLCAELLSALENEGYAHWTTPPHEDELCLRARAALAEPELQPIPVSKRLPGPEDCDAEGKCWWGEPQIEDSHDATWSLCTQDDADEFLTWGTKCGWLPAHALPLPSSPSHYSV